MPEKNNNKTALLLFSGGQDSATCLAWTLKKFSHVETIGFTYGQRHDVEMTARIEVLEGFRELFPECAPGLGPDHIFDLPALASISETALTRQQEIEISNSGLPNTFVPGRNLLFFTYAAALAWRRKLDILVGGMCETDYSGYPDCRNQTLQTLSASLSLGMDRDMPIETPLMHLSKAETWALAHRLGGDKLITLLVEKTHTCYIGDHQTHHDWGYGCGTCPACVLRARGYRQWQSGV